MTTTTQQSVSFLLSPDSSFSNRNGTINPQHLAKMVSRFLKLLCPNKKNTCSSKDHSFFKKWLGSKKITIITEITADGIKLTFSSNFPLPGKNFLLKVLPRWIQVSDFVEASKQKEAQDGQ